MQVKNILATLALFAAATGPVLASDRCSEPRENWMSEDALRAKTEAQGYKIKKIKEEDGCYEVYAMNPAGDRIELYVNPKSGEIVRKKAND